MTETTETHKRRNEPTPKMLEFALRISERKGVPFPEAARDNFDLCKAFLDQYGAELPPSQKAVDWAHDLARKKQIPLSAEVLADARKLSEWIDEHR